MNDMKERLKSIKEYLAKFSKKTLITAAVIAAVVILGAVITAVVLNHKEYETLYTDLTSEEMTEIIGMCDRALIMAQGRITGELDKDFLNEDTIIKLAMEG